MFLEHSIVKSAVREGQHAMDRDGKNTTRRTEPSPPTLASMHREYEQSMDGMRVTYMCVAYTPLHYGLWSGHPREKPRPVSREMHASTPNLSTHLVSLSILMPRAACPFRRAVWDYGPSH